VNPLKKWLLGGLFAVLAAAGGCKDSPPSAETDPEKAKQVEQQAADEGKREGQAQQK
jgi:hypothetical protein